LTITTTRALQLFQVMRQGAVILTSILLAKSGLSTADIGAYEVLLYIGTVLTFFWINGLLQAMPPIYTKLGPEDRKAFIFNAFLLFCGFSVLLSAVLLVGQGGVVPLLTGLNTVPFFEIFCLFLLFNLPTYPVEYIYLLEKKPYHIVGWGVASFGLQVIAVATPLALGLGLKGGISALLVLGILKWLWTLLLVFRSGIVKIRPDLMNTYLRFAWPLVLNILIGNFVLMFDNWLVGWWYHDEAVFAVYRYGARELPLAQALATALGVALIPRLSEDFTGGLADMRAMTRKLFHLLFPFTIVLLFISKPLFPLVFNPDFAHSADLFNVYLLMTASRVLLPNSILLSKGEPRVILAIGLLELLVKIVLGFLMIQYFGLPGVAWSAVAAFWVEKAGLIWYLKHKHQIKPAQYIDLKWYAAYTCALVGAFILSHWAF
jgi:O-antigen/teichoic acid export membrane protein